MFSPNWIATGVRRWPPRSPTPNRFWSRRPSTTTSPMNCPPRSIGSPMGECIMTNQHDESDEGHEYPEARGHDRAGLDLAREVADGYRGREVQRAQSERAQSERVEPAQTQSARSRARRRRPTGRAEPAREKDPAPVADHMRNLIREQGWEGELAAQRVFDEWPDIVGAEVAAHCQIVGHADGQVHVQADSTAWATQFRLLSPRVVAKLNERLGDGTVVRIDVRGPQAPSWKAGRRSVRGRGPRDTY